MSRPTQTASTGNPAPGGHPRPGGLNSLVWGLAPVVLIPAALRCRGASWWVTSPTTAPVLESFALTRCVRNDLPLSIPEGNGVAVTPVIAGFHRSKSVGLAYTRKRVGASEPTRVKDRSEIARALDNRRLGAYTCNMGAEKNSNL
jgi:hypothetical protein